MEHRTAIKFCVKLKKTATETFEMLKRAYSEECSLEQACFIGVKGSKKGSESENTKITVENNVDRIFWC
jgi:hypothetical protein